MKKAIFIFFAVVLAIPSISLATDTTTYNDCDVASYIAPVVSATENSDSITLSWDEIVNDNLDGYKVVISKNDSTPAYPANGYLKWITDTSVTSWEINNSSAYYNGDFGSYLEEGEDYYFSVTAVYDCEKIAGNVLHLTYPGSSSDDDSDDEDSTTALPVPVVSVSSSSDGVLVSWEKIDDSRFSGYKVVASKNDSTPAYPANGYLKYITNSNTVSYLIDNSSPYYSGDFDGWFQVGEEYYFSVTALYNDQKIAGNTIAATYNGPSTDDSEDDDDTSNVALPTPEVSLSSSDDGVLLSWEKIDDSRFNGYKVVISASNSKPSYPADGYLKYITDEDVTSYLVNNDDEYRSGDFGAYLRPGEDYYFSITALYDSGRVAGNAILATYNGKEGRTIIAKDPLQEMERKAEQLRNNELGDILAEMERLRNRIQEQENEIKYLRGLVNDLSSIAQEVRDSINQFITYGVDENTQLLGEGERAAVIYSFKSAFNKLPETDQELADAIRIANGRWPSVSNEAAETRAKAEFRKIYLREPDMSNPNDNAAVTIMAYGLRQKAENRNLSSEEQGINTFRYIYGYLPNSTEDWNIMQAITYSGATR